MEQLHGLLQDLALILVVAAVTTVIFQKLKQPVVLGYLLAGLIVGPHIPIPLFADIDRIHTLSELGIILVMFAIGLEFSFRKLARLATTAGVVGVLQICIMFWLGYVLGLTFGWTRVEALFTGAMMSVSSTMIIAKAFSEQAITGKLSDLVIGVLIIEDVAAILMIAILTAFSTGEGVPIDVLFKTGFQLTGFLLASLLLGFLIVPRAIRIAARLNSDETLLVASVGICFAYALIAQKVGYSVALGAFIAGALISESGHTAKIEHLVRPLRDVFAAVFFISVGMLMNPLTLVEHWQSIVLIAIAVLVGKIFSVALGAFFMGYDLRTSVRSGMSMAQIGEFSFIIAAAGVATGSIREFLYPVAIAVCVITTFTTPWLIRVSDSAARSVDRILPNKLKTLATLYGSWVEKTRSTSNIPVSTKRKILRILVMDLVILTGIIAVFSFYKGPIERFLISVLPATSKIAGAVNYIGLGLISAPFLISIVRAARMLGATLATEVLPENSRLDLANVPRKTMSLVIEFATVLTAGTILLAVTSPFLPEFAGIMILAIILIVFGMIVWRDASDLEEHVRAASQVIIEALSKGTHPPETVQMEQILPGLGNIFSLELHQSNPAVGKSLADLDIHSLTGALVVGIARNGGPVIAPASTEVLRAGDILALVGSQEALESAKKLLT